MKLVIVEDSERIRTQLMRLIDARPGIAVVGSATAEEEALALILATGADAVLLDLALAPGSGLQVLRRSRQLGNRAKVLVLTNNNQDAIRRACLASGASGFFDKSHEVEACLDLLFSWLPPPREPNCKRMPGGVISDESGL